MLSRGTKNFKSDNGDNAANPGNYRPTSLLNVFDKFLEKLMYNRLYSFLHKHKIFYRY